MSDSGELCPKCGSEMSRWKDSVGDDDVYLKCPLETKDCRIKELERQLEEVEGDRQGHIYAAQHAESQLREAQLEVVALRQALKKIKNSADGLQRGGMTLLIHRIGAAHHYEVADKALPNTSATAQKVKAQIEREALEKAWERCEKRLKDKGCTDDTSRLRAAILGETK